MIARSVPCHAEQILFRLPRLHAEERGKLTEMRCQNRHLR